MKKFVVATFVLCGILQADIIPTNPGDTSYMGVSLDTNYAYAVVDVPKGRGVVGVVFVDSATAQCQTASSSSDFFKEVCLLGKRETFDKVANIKILKNASTYATGTIVYSKTKSVRSR